MREARSRGRAEFAMPCPLHVQATFTMPSAGRDSGSDVGTSAATWHECPLCGMRWATGTKARVRRRAVEKVPTDEASESEEEEPGNSEEFEALLNAMDYLDLLTLRPSGEIDAEERARTEEGVLSYYHEIKLIHSYYSTTGNIDLEDDRADVAAFTMDKGELMRFVKDCDLLGEHDRGSPFLTRHELDLMFIRANWDGPAGSNVEQYKDGKREENLQDSEAELTFAEFAELLLRIAAHRKTKLKVSGLARSLHEMMEQHVLPHAQRDTMANLRGLIAKQRELRHVVYMCVMDMQCTCSTCMHRHAQQGQGWRTRLLAPQAHTHNSQVPPSAASALQEVHRVRPTTHARPPVSQGLRQATRGHRPLHGRIAHAQDGRADLRDESGRRVCQRAGRRRHGARL